MRGIVVTRPGGPEQLRLTDLPDPVPGPGEVLIYVIAAGLNRADLMQREGHYPPPPGASDILGMECSGRIAALGAGVAQWQVGDPVCALLAGGGYAEQVVVPAVQVLPAPEGIGLIEAAALPEATGTVWSNLVMTAHLAQGQTLLVHGGGSGIGTMAVQLGKALGARVVVTASRAATLDACARLGADVLLDYSTTDFVEVLTGLGGADVVLDVVGAKYLARNISALRDGGRVIVIGMQGGSKTEFDLGTLLPKRAGIIGTTLRSRPVSGPGSKADVVAAVRAHVWPLLAAGTVRPVIDSVLPLAEAAAAHRKMAEGGHVGKILLRVREEQT